MGGPDSVSNAHTLIAILRKVVIERRSRERGWNVHVTPNWDQRLSGNGGHSGGMAKVRASSKAYLFVPGVALTGALKDSWLRWYLVLWSSIMAIRSSELNGTIGGRELVM